MHHLVLNHFHLLHNPLEHRLMQSGLEAAESRLRRKWG
jgi:hypothetical protein